MRSIAALVLTVLFAAPAAAVQVTGPRPSNSPMIVPQIGNISVDQARGIMREIPAEKAGKLDPTTPKGRAEIMAARAASSSEVKAEIVGQIAGVVSQGLYQDDSAEALEALSDAIETFVDTYHSVLSGTEAMQLMRTAREARAMAHAKQTAAALGQGRADEAVPVSETANASRLGRPGQAARDEAVSRIEARPLRASLTEPEAEGKEPKKGFNWFNAGLYTGVFLIMGSFGWFMVQNWMVLGAYGIMAVSGLMAGVLGLSSYFARKHGFPQVAGLLTATAVGMTPLFSYGLLAAFGKAPGSYHSYYTKIDLGWVFIEAMTIAVAAATAFFTKAKSSMVAFPAAVAAWFLSMDLARLFTGTSMASMSETHAWFSVVSGMVMFAVGRVIERLTKVDYPFWIYLAGLLAFSGGLLMLPSNGELGKLLFAAVHAGLIVAGLFLQRKTFAVFGALGVFGYVGHLFVLFAASVEFPIVVAFTGLGIIGLTVLTWVKREAIKAWFRRHFPDAK